jgi:flagellar hook assembly protein FlgD
MTAPAIDPAAPVRDAPAAGRPGTPSARRPIVRGIARGGLLVITLLAILLTSSTLLRANAAQGASPKRAVVVVGPVHERTSRYLEYGRDMADAAEQQGMEVVRIFHPNATKERVKRFANGAHLFIYAGHGNGWPSAFGPFQERTKNGIGINPTNGDRTTSNVKYYGADWLRANIELAPDAVVILSHLSYASGNASSGMPIPTQSVAVQRVDNFANGFLDIGARVVWALGWQPGADVIRALNRDDATMDAVFMTRYREPASPGNGWIGWRPGYFDSVRTPGAEIHIDPHQSAGYLRAVTGDLAFTTNEWRGSDQPPEDTVAPVISDVTARQAAVTVATEGVAPIFTPNHDLLSDTITIRHTLSEPSFIDIRVFRLSNDKVVRRMNGWSRVGRSPTVWDGTNNSGDVVPEGRYRLEFTPRDRAGNVGEPGSVTVKVLAAMKRPRVAPGFFFAEDDDALARTATFRTQLTKPGKVTILVRDASGTVVRTGIDGQRFDSGRVKWAWDGKDDAGAYVDRGVYTGRARIARPQGTYAHDVDVLISPFVLEPSDRTVTRGQTLTLLLTSAEPLEGKPTLKVKQPGLEERPLRKIRRLSATTFRVRYHVSGGGGTGSVRVTVTATDVDGGTQTQKLREITIE